MPESNDSIGNGTRISRVNTRPNGGRSPAAAGANSHGPLRLCHSARTSDGRGYSGKGSSRSTSNAARVTSRSGGNESFDDVHAAMHAQSRTKAPRNGPGVDASRATAHPQAQMSFVERWHEEKQSAWLYRILERV